jgi:hypothetical protein
MLSARPPERRGDRQPRTGAAWLGGLWAAATAAVLIVALPPTPAAADGHCEVVETESGYRVVCEDESHGAGGGGGNGSGTTQPVRVEGFYSVVLRWAPELGDEERCWFVRFNPRPGSAPGEDGSWTYAEAYAEGRQAWGHHPQCPGQDGGGPPDPTAAVLSLWSENQPVPDFTPEIAPGWALTGMPAYLDVQGDRAVTASYELPAPFPFDVRLDASATYEVDWGDGSPVVTGITAPGPWPDGEARHTYVHAEPVTVTVTAVWSGTWRAGPFGGELPVLRRSQQLPLEVRQLQAVRVAGG